MSYTSVFGGNTIYPSDVSYLAVALDANIELEWPLESSGELPPAARILDVTPDTSGWNIVLPDATLTGAGQTILFNNLSGAESFFVTDFAGNTLATVDFGEQWQVYLAATTTAAGTWRVFRYGASTATVQPSALAGFGLTVTDSTLSQSLPVTTFSTSGLTVATSNRASAFVWNAAGSGTLNLLTAASAGNNFFVFVRNEGGGDLVVEPSGTEQINSGANLTLRPGDSATAITDGVEWYTIGLGQQAVFAFDYTSISVTGGNYTLAGSELNRIAYKFVGTLASDVYVIVPPTIQQYWIDNATTGAFSFFIQTSGGTPVEVNQGARGIYYCDGTSMVLASDPTTLTTPIVISDGGTGATTASGARLSLGITSFADAIVTATTAAGVRSTIGAAASGANSDITSLTGLTTPISIAQGGTGATSASAARSAFGAAASGANTDITSLSPSGGLQVGSPTGGAQGNGTVNATGLFVNGVAVGVGSGSVSSVNVSGGTTGLSFSGGPVTTSGTITMGGTLGIGNGGTGASDAGTARSNLSVPSTAGSGAFGTWGISISGSAASASSATTATTATTANALNTGNNYQVNSLGVGTAGSGTAGEIRATNNVTAYYSSDARLKENVQSIENALGIVSAVGGKTFDWTDAYIAEHGGEDGYFVTKSDFGVIAQDVQAVFPLAVRTREDGTLAVDYEKLVAVAFAAIAELKAEVEALKK